jgi:hypothetical protein
MRTRRGLPLLLVTALLATLGLAAVGSPAHADVVYYDLRHRDSWKCVDVRTQDPQVAQLWSCSGASEQAWALNWLYLTPNDPASTNYAGFYMFINRRYGGCLASEGSYVYHETDEWRCDPYTFSVSRWNIFGSYYADGKWSDIWDSDVGTRSSCLALQDNNSRNGTQFTLEPCDRMAPAQHWNLTNH